MQNEWKPARSLEECARLLDAPGSMWETEEITIKGRTVRAYKKLPKTGRDFWLGTRVFAKSDYIVYNDEKYTYEQTHKNVRAVVALFQQRGVVKGTRIAICMRNYPEFVISFWAAHALGAIVVAVNAWNAPEVVEHCLLKTTPVILIVDDERASLLLPKTSTIIDAGCATLFVVRAGGTKYQGFETWEEALKPFELEDAPYPEVEVLPDDPFAIYFTSGTTSLPKGVLSTQRQALTNLFNASVGHARAALRRGDSLPVPDPKRRQRAMLLAIPLFHVTGCHSYLFQATAAGGKIVLMRKWDLQEAVRLIEKEKITTAGGIPYLVMGLMSALQDNPDHSLEGFSFGGAPAPAGMVASFKKMRAKMTVTQAYGMSETNAIIVNHVGEDYLARPTSTGVPCPVNEIKIRHLETQEELPSNTTGEVWVKGVNVAEGYWNDPKASEVFKPDGWYQSGDLGRLDDDGFLHITDRAKEIIIRGGENISSVQVESTLYGHPGVQEAAVVAVPDELLGELVSAAVVLKPEYVGKISSQDLIAFVGKSLPKHCVPVLIQIRSELLARNASGKVLKNLVKEEMGRLWAENGKVKAKL